MKTKQLLFVLVSSLLLSACSIGISESGSKDTGSSIPSSSQTSEEPGPQHLVGDAGDYPDNDKDISFDDAIKSVNFKGFITGVDATTPTLTDYGIGGTDLGYPLYDPDTGKTYLFFGDTFSGVNGSMSGSWRSQTIGVTSDTNFNDGLSWDSFVSRTNQTVAKEAVSSHKQDRFEMTKIPTGVFKLNGVFYMFYFSKWSWNNGAYHSMSYCGCVKSTDECKTWTRVHDLTWIDHVTDNPNEDWATLDQIKILVNEGADLTPGVANIDIAKHEGYHFTEITPRLGDDGYVYIYGQGGYRTDYLYMGRVLADKFEQFDQYEYLTGYDADREPIWVKGRAGMDALNAAESKASACKTTMWEMTVFYSKYLKRYCVCTASQAGVNDGAVAYRIFTSKNIYGPFTNKGINLCNGYHDFLPKRAGPYAPMVNDNWQTEDGKTIFMVVSTWTPYYNPILLKVEFN